MISCFHLTIAFAGGERPLFDDASFKVEAGSWTELTGPTGCGKSVLFDVLSLRAAPRHGQVLVAGRNLERLRADGYAELRRQVGSCGERPDLLAGRTVIENLVLPMLVRGEAHAAVGDAEALLATMDCGHLRDMPVDRLAREERLVVAALRAMVGRPKLIVLDAVLELVTPHHAHKLSQQLDDRRERGATIVVFGRALSPFGPPDREHLAIADGEVAPATGISDDGMSANGISGDDVSGDGEPAAPEAARPAREEAVC